LRRERLTPRLLWENVFPLIQSHDQAYIIFDDTVLDKRYSEQIESCQCRNARIQRNHIACAMLVWLRLKDLAYKTYQTVYQLKHGLLSNYLIEQLKRPALPMSLV